MYDDLTLHDCILLAIQHIAKGTDVPAALLARLPDTVKDILCQSPEET